MTSSVYTALAAILLITNVEFSPKTNTISNELLFTKEDNINNGKWAAPFLHNAATRFKVLDQIGYQRDMERNVLNKTISCSI